MEQINPDEEILSRGKANKLSKSAQFAFKGQGLQSQVTTLKALQRKKKKIIKVRGTKKNIHIQRSMI